jgi:hypothetical protein
MQIMADEEDVDTFNCFIIPPICAVSPGPKAAVGSSIAKFVGIEVGCAGEGDRLPLTA